MAGTSLAASLISLDFVAPEVEEEKVTIPVISAAPAVTTPSPDVSSQLPDALPSVIPSGATSVIPVILTPTADGKSQVVTIGNHDQADNNVASGEIPDCSDGVPTIKKEEPMDGVIEDEQLNGSTTTHEDGPKEDVNGDKPKAVSTSTQSKTWEELATNLVLEVVTQQVTKIRGLQETTGPTCVHIDGMTWKDIVAMIVEKHNKTCGHTGVQLHHNMVGLTSNICDRPDTPVVMPPPLTTESHKRKGVRTRGRGRGKMLRGRGQFGPKNAASQDNSQTRTMTSFEAEFNQTVKSILNSGQQPKQNNVSPLKKSANQNYNISTKDKQLLEKQTGTPMIVVKPVSAVGGVSNQKSGRSAAVDKSDNIKVETTTGDTSDIIDITQCKICKKWFKSKSQLTKHNIVHEEDRGPHPCEVCKKLFKTAWNLEKHMENMHKELCPKDETQNASPPKKVNKSRVAKTPSPSPNKVAKVRATKRKLQVFNSSSSGHQLRPINEHEFTDNIDSAKSSAGDEQKKESSPAGKDDKVVAESKPSDESNSHHEEEDDDDDDGELLTCEICNTAYATIESLEMHQQTHKKTIIQVSRQGKVIGKPLVKKVSGPLGVNKSSLSKCLVCKEVFRSKMQLEKHMSIHSQDNGEHLCTHCGKSCRTEWNLKRHLLIHAKVKQHKCPECDASFGTHVKLMKHRGTEHGYVETFSCKECGVKYKNRVTLKYHMMEHSGGSLFECDVCNKTFSRPDALRVHKHQHKPKIFKCSLCPKAYPFRSMLVRHWKFAHTKDKLVCCRFCNETFPSYYQKNAHEETHTGQRPHQCQVCGKGFLQKSALLTHERSHTGEKPFQCSVCDKGFASKGHALRHEKSHDENRVKQDRPFKCSMCDSRFVWRHQWQGHENRHRGIKPHKCKECPAAFASKTYLTRHLKTHINSTNHTCSYCQETFPMKTKLEKHEMEQHLQFDSEEIGAGKKTVVVVMKIK